MRLTSSRGLSISIVNELLILVMKKVDRDCN
jgi:hypothetical protein